MNFIYSDNDYTIFNTLLSQYENKKLSVYMDNNLIQIKTILKKSLFNDNNDIYEGLIFDLYVSDEIPKNPEIIKPGGMLIIKNKTDEIDKSIYSKELEINEYRIIYKNVIENLKNAVFIKNNMIPNETYKMTIITPCYKIGEHLKRLKESIDFKYVDEWIIIYDCKIKNLVLSFKESLKIKEMAITKITEEEDLINKGIESASKLNTFIYIISENGKMHPNIFNLFKFNLLEKRCYIFNQDRKKNEIILKGKINALLENNMVLYYRNNYREIKYTTAYEFTKNCRYKEPKNIIYIDSTLSFSI